MPQSDQQKHDILPAVGWSNFEGNSNKLVSFFYFTLKLYRGRHLYFSYARRQIFAAKLKTNFVALGCFRGWGMRNKTGYFDHLPAFVCVWSDICKINNWMLIQCILCYLECFIRILLLNFMCTSRTRTLYTEWAVGFQTSQHLWISVSRKELLDSSTNKKSW